MNALLDAIFGLDGVGFGDEGVLLEFARPMPGWAWALIVPVAGALAVAGYARVRWPLGRRALLASVRGVVLVLLVVLLSGPQLVRPNERVEPDRVLVLADRSASMRIGDAGVRGARETRDASLLRATDELLRGLGPDTEDRVVELIGFDSRTFAIERAAGDGPGQLSLGEPEGERTLLGRAVATTLARAAGRPLAGVVVLTDGRSADSIAPSVTRDLQAAGAPVFAVALGQEASIGDVRLARATAPNLAFEADRVPVTLELAGATPGTEIEIVDLKTGRSLASERLEQGSPAIEGQPITLTIDPPGLGPRDLAVRVTPSGEDLVLANNEARLSVRFIDRSVRVLYLDGYPRWEYRYLKNLLSREPSMTSSTMLVSNRHEYLQEGDIALTTLPDSPEEWAPFDVIILGDLRPELLGERRLAQLRDHIAERGAGLIWIAGEGGDAFGVG